MSTRTEATPTPSPRLRPDRVVRLALGWMLVLLSMGVHGRVGAQETPELVTNELLQRALDQRLEVSDARRAETAAVLEKGPPVQRGGPTLPLLIGMFGIGIAGFTIRGVRQGALGGEGGWRGRWRFWAREGLGSEEDAPELEDPRAESVGGGAGPDLLSPRSASGDPRRGAPEPEALKLPAHVLEMLVRSADANRASTGSGTSPDPDADDAPGAAEPSAQPPAEDDPAAGAPGVGGIDVLVPR